MRASLIIVYGAMVSFLLVFAVVAGFVDLWDRVWIVGFVLGGAGLLRLVVHMCEVVRPLPFIVLILIGLACSGLGLAWAILYSLTHGHWAENVGATLVLAVIVVEFVRLVSARRNLTSKV